MRVATTIQKYKMVDNMNIFVFCGTLHNESVTRNVVDQIVCTLKRELPISNVYWADPITKKINSCVGCQNCFTHGICTIRDDIESLEVQMEKSQIIVFASPVYMHNVSGAMKDFIDRIAHWSHYFRLRGKLGISLNTSTSNGNSFVAEYLNKVLSSLGCCVASNISITSSGLTSKSMESIISVNARKVVQIISRKTYPITSEQEILFQNYCKFYREKNLTPYEMDYWSTHHLSSYASFNEMFLSALDDGLTSF